MARATRFTAATLAVPATLTTTTLAATARATALRATLLIPARILVRLVLTGLAAFRARRVRTFLDLELRRRRELDRALQQLLDVLEQRHFIR